MSSSSYSTIYKAFIWGSVISFIIGGFTDSITSFKAYMAGYSTLILGISMIFITFLSVKEPQRNTYGAFILILAIISYMFYLLINYKTNILKGHVAPGYNSFSNIIVILLLMQLYIIFDAITQKGFETAPKISGSTLGFIYLLSILTGINTIILNTILKYYSTDGFTIFG